MRERETHTHRQRQRGRDRQRETETDRDRDRERDRDRQRDKQSKAKRNRRDGLPLYHLLFNTKGYCTDMFMYRTYTCTLYTIVMLISPTLDLPGRV